jgi:DNA-binding NarL/FixJ family response regulator
VRYSRFGFPQNRSVPAIAVIDDRQPIRETLRELLALKIENEEGWEVVDVAPLRSLTEYPGWIDEASVAVVLTDERLHEGAEADAGEPVEYNGHDLVDFLRPRYPSLPIYVVTAYPFEEPLATRFGRVEDVIIKGELTDKAGEYAERFVRAGSNFFEEHQAELERLASLSRTAALGEANADEIAEMRALQERLGIPFDTSTASRSQWMGAFEAAIADLERVEKQLQKLKPKK